MAPALSHPRKIWDGLSGSIDDARQRDLFHFATLPGEGHGIQHFKEGVALFVQCRAGKDEPLGLDDLLINASPYVIQSKITDLGSVSRWRGKR